MKQRAVNNVVKTMIVLGMKSVVQQPVEVGAQNHATIGFDPVPALGFGVYHSTADEDDAEQKSK